MEFVEERTEVLTLRIFGVTYKLRGCREGGAFQGEASKKLRGCISYISETEISFNSVLRENKIDKRGCK